MMTILLHVYRWKIQNIYSPSANHSLHIKLTYTSKRQHEMKMLTCKLSNETINYEMSVANLRVH